MKTNKLNKRHGGAAVRSSDLVRRCTFALDILRHEIAGVEELRAMAVSNPITAAKLVSAVEAINRRVVDAVMALPASEPPSRTLRKRGRTSRNEQC